MKYPHLAARIFNTPLLIAPGKLDAIIAGLGERLSGRALQLPEAAHALAPAMFSTKRGADSGAGYTIVDGVAVLNIGGALVHRTRMEADSTMLLGYNDLSAALENAMADPAVHAVLQVYDSPGGEVQGAFEYAERVAALRGKKPLHAIADGMAASAAYLGASAADSIAISATGYAGSIGVVMRHVDFSRALEADGVQVTHIFAGAHKIDGNQFEPLPSTVRAELQADINGLYELFISAVAEQRGMSADAVRATQAAIYRGQHAIKAGLADRIATTDQMITELAGQRAQSYPAGPLARSTAIHTERKQMAIENHDAPAGAAPTPATAAAPSFAQADIDKAHASGMAAGATAERERTGAILGHPNAGANAALALTCITTGMTVEQATAVLASVPAAAATAAAPANPFAAAMAGVANPAVSGIEGGASTAAASDSAALASQMLAAFNTR